MVSPEIRIWLGGPEVSFDVRERLTDWTFIDGIMYGEGEDTFRDMAACWNGAADIESVEGIGHRHPDGRVHVHPSRDFVDMSRLNFVYTRPEDFKNKIIYYNKLTDSRKNDYTEWIKFFLKMCTVQAEKHIKYIDKSMQQVKSIDTTLSVTDTEILVYQYIKEVDLMEDNSAVITTNNRTLGSSYELGNSIHTEKQENIYRNDLFKMCLEKKYFSDYLIEDGVLTFDVSKENISKVFNTENFEITNDATFTFTFKNKQLVSMNCVFQTLSLKNVNIDVTYQY